MQPAHNSEPPRAGESAPALPTVCGARGAGSSTRAHDPPSLSPVPPSLYLPVVCLSELFVLGTGTGNDAGVLITARDDAQYTAIAETPQQQTVLVNMYRALMYERVVTISRICILVASHSQSFDDSVVRPASEAA